MCVQGAAFDWERWFSKRCKPVNCEVLSCETRGPFQRNAVSQDGTSRFFHGEFQVKTEHTLGENNARKNREKGHETVEKESK